MMNSYSSPFEQFILNAGEIFCVLSNMNMVVFVIFLEVMMFFSFLFFYRRDFMRFFQFVMRSLYIFCYNTVESYLNEKAAIYFPFVYYLFISIIFLNLVGLLPFAFTVTSHFVVTFTIAFIVWYGVVFITFFRVGYRFLDTFVPKGIDLPLGSFISMVEIVSYFFRVVSLALRLFANIVAGHILLETLALFAFKYVSSTGLGVSIIGILCTLLPLFVMFVFFLFECVIAIVQAYVFILLTCIYLQDAFRYRPRKVVKKK